MTTNLKRQDYRNPEWSRKELILTVGKAGIVVCFFAGFFYRSVWAVIPMSVVGVLYFRMAAQKRREHVREELTLQFKECILSVATSLKAGYAVENAFVESRSDMQMLYGPKSFIYQELELIRRGLIINITLQEQLEDLAERSGSEEICQFATIFSIAKRSGGSLPEIIRDSAELIGRRVDARQEMRTMLSGRQMEQNIMKIMPFGVLGYIGLSYPGYFDILYHNLQGAAIMTVCLVIYLAAYVMGEKILQKIGREMA